MSCRRSLLGTPEFVFASLFLGVSFRAQTGDTSTDSSLNKSTGGTLYSCVTEWENEALKYKRLTKAHRSDFTPDA